MRSRRQRRRGSFLRDDPRQEVFVFRIKDWRLDFSLRLLCVLVLLDFLIGEVFQHICVGFALVQMSVELLNRSLPHNPLLYSRRSPCASDLNATLRKLSLISQPHPRHAPNTHAIECGHSSIQRFH